MTIKLGYTTFRNHNRPFGIRAHDLRQHMLVIGKTGVGKSTLLTSMFRQQARAGIGCGIIDPHGDVAELLAREFADDPRLLYLDVPGRGSWRFNPLAGTRRGDHPRVAAGVLEIFEKLYSTGWGPRLEHVLRHVLLTLLEVPGAHLGDISRLLLDDAYRARACRFVTNDVVASFWASEYAGYSKSMQSVVVGPILNKISAFMTDPRLQSVLATSESTVDSRKVLDSSRILVVNLSKGVLGEGPSSLLGSLLVHAISLAALSRADLLTSARRPFFLYLDEYQTLSTMTLATMLSELRKFGLGMVLAHQHLGQVEAPVRDAVLGNCGSLLVFRVSAADARFLIPELPRGLTPRRFEVGDLITQPNFNFYVKLMIGGNVGKAFSATSMRMV